MGGEEDEEDEEEVKLFESILFWYKMDHNSGADGNLAMPAITLWEKLGDFGGHFDSVCSVRSAQIADKRAERPPSSQTTTPHSRMLMKCPI